MREGQLERHVRLFLQFMQRCFPLQVKSPRRGMFKQIVRERGEIHGDTSGCFLGFVDIKTKVEVV